MTHIDAFEMERYQSLYGIAVDCEARKLPHRTSR